MSEKTIVQLGRRLRWLRQRAGLKKSQLAQEADISATYVKKLEDGAAVPTLLVAIRLANVFGLRSLEELTGPFPSSRYGALRPRLDAEWSYFLSESYPDDGS